uniref:DUF4283 domain-containing protein n=1 Tax=Quercus lobata TaxID=97700 RepID=A0A7N2KTI6_QUELO
MERERLKRSEEEEDALARSTKKFKESHSFQETNEKGKGIKIGSYKDKLVGAMPGAFAQAFGLKSAMQEDLESNIEEESDQDGSLRIGFSREEKVQMRTPWQKALIIKTFGRRMAFSFLVERVRKMWNPCGGMDCIDLGYDYFLVKFELDEDVDTILMGGPWFIGQQFIAIRQWEPEFKASTATLSSVAVWIRLPELPIEYYEPNALLKIGKAIGPILRIDSHTANGEKGRFARLCIQVNLDKPLPKEKSMGRSGEETGEQKDDQAGMQSAQEAEGLKKKEDVQQEYREWMVVNRRKGNNRARSVQRVQTVSHTADVQMTQSSIAITAEPSVASMSRRDGKRKSLHTQPVVSQREMATSNHSQLKSGKGAKNKGISSRTNQKATKSIGLQPKEVGQSSKSGLFVFGSNLEQGLFCFSGSLNPKVTHLESSSPTGKENTATKQYSSGDGRQGEVGDSLQRKDHTEEQAAGLLAFERRGVDHNAEPMVEVFDGSASSTKHSDDKLRAISNKIRNAELGKISIGSRSDVDGDSDFRNEEIDQLPGRMLVDGQPSQGENDPVCRAQIKRNDCSQGNTRGLGNNHALSDSNQGDLGVEERDVGGMEIEKH